MALDLRKLAALGTAIGMRTAGNAKEEITLHLGNAQGEYDPESNQHAPVAGTEATIQALGYKRKNAQSGATLQIAERTINTNVETILVEMAELRRVLILGGMDPEAAAAVAITQEDHVTRATGRWEIVGVEYPPGGAMVLLDIRQ